jgi:hypothetical protein
MNIVCITSTLTPKAILAGRIQMNSYTELLQEKWSVEEFSMDMSFIISMVTKWTSEKVISGSWQEVLTPVIIILSEWNYLHHSHTMNFLIKPLFWIFKFIINRYFKKYSTYFLFTFSILSFLVPRFLKQSKNKPPYSN